MKNNILMFLTPKEDTFYLKSDCTIRQVLEKLDYYKFSVVPLINDEGDYVTSVSEGDILRYIKNNASFSLKTAEDICVFDIPKYRPYEALSILTPFDDLIKYSLEQNFVPVVDDRGKYIGIVKRRNIIDKLYLDKK